MDVDNVFGLFGFGKDKNKSKKTENDIEEFRNTPQFKVGMFYKMIWNGNNFRDQIFSFFGNSNLEKDFTLGLDEASDYMMYTRAYYWIQECNLQDKEWEEALIYYLDKELINCLKLSIKYYEEIEEFEKCAFLKKIQTFLEKQELLQTLKEA